MDRVEHEKVIIQDLLNLHKDGALNLNPWYQRRSVWTNSQKAYLINTIFEQKPVPSIYIRHSLDIDADRSIREVVDGQQRIKAVLEFSQDIFAAFHPSYRKRVRYSQLTKSDLSNFKLTSLSVGYLLGATDEDVIEIFGRLNSVAKTINAQEKRNAKFSGDFKQFCLKEATSRLALWRNLNIFTGNGISRMDEVQFISDLILNLMSGLSDFSASDIDSLYETFDDKFPDQKEIADQLEKTFALIASLKPESIRDTVFHRPPLFFSLFIVLDSTTKQISAKRIEAALHDIDGLLSEEPPSGYRSAEAEFVSACLATTQRIKQRKIRHKFIKQTLGL